MPHNQQYYISEDTSGQGLVGLQAMQRLLQAKLDC